MKKNNVLILVILGALIAVCVGYSRGWAQASREILPARVGVINVERVFKDSQRHVKWQSQMGIETAKLQAKLESLAKEADVLEKAMRKRKVGSLDYLDLLSSYLDKVGEAQAKKKYYEQEMALKDRQWMGSFYNEIRSVVEKTAKLRRLDIVLVANEIDLGPMEVTRVIDTTKVLYHTDKINITEDVIAQLDSAL